MKKCQTGTCVEYLIIDECIHLKSTEREGVVFFTREEWEPFVETIKKGEFDTWIKSSTTQ